ncbi:MAG: S24/S26 family peptidase [Prevotella shahii]|jgi:hypothetical protein|uniref:Peptidase S41 n=1 Tax=Hoylesella shahii DSM 15611 = JCM 12083 TaxID=1122991 RepID=A0A318I1J1_9BACT|nr:S24/S26 family peptidase [Hoylesella shahii]MBF1567694.1 S24/S26 family peptidase [Hoylesella shahii]MBF1591496.1 S24/S26 family peptidase [Hoylesella shahii]PXX24442.1 hypothetical protein EJ73_00247 [Hoylesella shahii DSM 15611 = JCM 12083]
MSTNHSEIRELEFENARFLPEVIRFLDEGHTVTLGLKGYSMRPFLEHKRDKALLSRPTTLQKGDAVLAEIAPGVFVLHRIVKIEGDDITLRGDGNLAIERCKKTDVKGFALGFYRKGREKIDKTNSLKWRIYSALWTTLLPMRRYLLAFYSRIWIRLFGPI